MLPFRDHNPTRTFPLVTITLIIVNVLVMLYMYSLQMQGGEPALEAFVRRAAVVPAAYLGWGIPPNYLEPFWLTTFTAMFMHGGLAHLGGNMLYLWIFGNNIEDAMGPLRFLLFYLLCGVLATVAHIASVVYAVSASGSQASAAVPALGASGAIAGVLGAYLVRYPRAQIDTCVFFIFVTVIRLPAIIVLAFWFVIQFISGVGALVDVQEGGGVAFWAHIGGFLAGMILINAFARPQRNRYNRY